MPVPMPAHILRPVSACIRSVIENLQCEEGSAIVGKTFCRRERGRRGEVGCGVASLLPGPLADGSFG